MKLTDEVTIIVVNCNNGEHFKKCIESIKLNTSGEYRIIVIDQNSKDGTREWMRDNIGHIIFDKKRNGRADGRNKGLRVTNTQWVALIDPDSLIEDNCWLDKMWNYTIDRRIGFVEAGVWVNKETQRSKMFAGTAFCLVRRECLQEIGFFDKEILHGNDLDFFTRLEWSWWKTGYCYDTNITNVTGRGIIQYSDMNLLKEDALKNIGFKYTMNFVEMTLVKNIYRRNNVLKTLEEQYGNSKSGTAVLQCDGSTGRHDSNSRDVEQESDSKN